jgi:hypothetical protein
VNPSFTVAAFLCLLAVETGKEVPTNDSALHNCDFAAVLMKTGYIVPDVPQVNDPPGLTGPYDDPDDFFYDYIIQRSSASSNPNGYGIYSWIYRNTPTNGANISFKDFGKFIGIKTQATMPGGTHVKQYSLVHILRNGQVVEYPDLPDTDLRAGRQASGSAPTRSPGHSPPSGQANAVSSPELRLIR